MRFIGIDLAWSTRNPSGGAVIEGNENSGELVASALLGGDDEVIAFVDRHAGDQPALVAIDAPLVVPNESGRRPGEAELGACFARYQAGAHPANRARLAVDGVVRGEALVERLAALGFAHRPAVQALAPVRQVLEVYPHPAMIGLFQLKCTLKYKARPRRTLPTRLQAFAAYHRHLRNLSEPALSGAEELLDRNLDVLIPARLKDHEDRLDALMCAYTAHYLWRWGMARARVFGTLEHGYITTPVAHDMLRP